MATIQSIIDLIKNHGNDLKQAWFLFIAVLVSVNALLAFLAPLTPWTWDDRIETILGNWVAKLSGKK